MVKIIHKNGLPSAPLKSILFYKSHSLKKRIRQTTEHALSQQLHLADIKVFIPVNRNTYSFKPVFECFLRITKGFKGIFN